MGGGANAPRAPPLVTGLGLTDSFLMLSRNIRSVKQSLFVKVEKLKKIIGTDITYDKHEIMVTVNVTPVRDNPQPT